MMSRILSALSAAALLLSLGACAETELAAHVTKQLERSSDSGAGYGQYKLGTPYRVDGVVYHPKEDWAYDETGIASWYGPGFHGKRTANGDIFDMNDVTAAHRTLPLPSKVRVTNLENGRAISVIVNDRGPYARGRIIDLSRRAAQLLGFAGKGTARVRVQMQAQDSLQLAAEAGRQANAADRRYLAPPAAPQTPVEVARVDPPPASRTGQQLARRLNDPRPSVESVRQTKVYVQAGAFTRYELATRMLQRLASVARASISAVKLGDRSFYRVRLGPLASVDQADAVLDRVVAMGYGSARVVVD